MLELSIDLTKLERALTRLERGLEDELHEGLNKTLLFMQGVARETAPVDTGFLRASIYPVSATLNGFGAAMASAKTAAPDYVFMLDTPTPTGKLEGFLVAGAEYAANVNFGSFHRRGNTVRIGNRAGRIGIRLDDGGIATYTPGYLFMEAAIDQGRPVLKSQALAAFKRAKLKAGLA